MDITPDNELINLPVYIYTTTEEQKQKLVYESMSVCH